MTKTLSIDLTYGGALAAVTQMLADPAFRERVCDAQHATSRTVTSTGIPGTVSVDMVQPTQGVPSFASKLAGSEVRISTTETWSTPTSAALAIDTGTSIAHISGTIDLREQGGAVVEHIAIAIEVKVPLVGGKIESLIADLMTKAFTKQQEIGDAYLAG